MPHAEILLSALLFLAGLFLRCIIGPMGSEVSCVVRARMKTDPDMFGPSSGYAQAFALYNVAFGAGSIVGPVWAGWLEDWVGWGNMCWSLAVLSAVSVVPTVSRLIDCLDVSLTTQVLFTGGNHDEDE